MDYVISIDTVLPGEGSQNGGTEITITGSGFALFSFSSTEWNPGNEILSDAYNRALIANGEGCSGGWVNTVRMGGSECDIITADHMTITCVTPPNDTPGIVDTYDITVEVSCTDSSTPVTEVASGVFTYSDLLTPVVTGITPEQGSISGGDMITISGTGFSNVLSEISVKVRKCTETCFVGVQFSPSHSLPQLTTSHITQLGDSECTVTSTTVTSITCTTPPHMGGVFPVVVTVIGKGLASGDFEYEFVFAISSISHCEGYVHMYIL